MIVDFWNILIPYLQDYSRQCNRNSSVLDATSQRQQSSSWFSILVGLELLKKKKEINHNISNGEHTDVYNDNNTSSTCTQSFVSTLQPAWWNNQSLTLPVSAIYGKLEIVQSPYFSLQTRLKQTYGASTMHNCIS